MKLTTCEGDQLIEATKLWFARSGGVVDVKVKKVAVQHDNNDDDSIMPKGFSKINTWDGK